MPLSPKQLALCLRFRHAFEERTPRAGGAWPTITREVFGGIVIDHLQACRPHEMARASVLYYPLEVSTTSSPMVVNFVAAMCEAQDDYFLDQIHVADVLEAFWAHIGDSPRTFTINDIDAAIFYPSQYPAQNSGRGRPLQEPTREELLNAERYYPEIRELLL